VAPRPDQVPGHAGNAEPDSRRAQPDHQQRAIRRPGRSAQPTPLAPAAGADRARRVGRCDQTSRRLDCHAGPARHQPGDAVCRDGAGRLSSPDEHLIEWYQWFEDEKGLQDNAYSGKTKIYIHDKDGKLIEKYPFALGPKYTPLREKIHKKYWFERKAFWVEKGQGWDTREEDRIDRRWDLEQIFRKAIMEWEGDVPPPAYFKKALEWGFMNLEMSFRKRFVPHPDDPSKYILREDLDFSGGSLNDRLKDEKGESEKVKEWIDLFPDKKDDITTIETLNTLSRLIERESHPTDKLILLDFWDICQNDTEPRSDAEIARQLKTQRVHLSPQRIGQRRKRLMRTLQEIFCK